MMSTKSRRSGCQFAYPAGFHMEQRMLLVCLSGCGLSWVSSARRLGLGLNISYRSRLYFLWLMCVCVWLCVCVCVLNTSFWMKNQVTGLFVDSFFWVAYCDGQAFVHTPGKYYLVDCFAGKARLSKAWAEAGMSACTLDLSRGEDDVPWHDEYRTNSQVFNLLPVALAQTRYVPCITAWYQTSLTLAHVFA